MVVKPVPGCLLGQPLSWQVQRELSSEIPVHLAVVRKG